MNKIVKFTETKKTAKVIYVVSGLKEMTIYLDGKIEHGDITWDEYDKITNMVTEECANMTVGEREKIWNMF